MRWVILGVALGIPYSVAAATEDTTGTKASGDDVIEEIVVTGELRKDTLDTLPASISAECAAFFEMFGAAIRTANAVENHQKPDARDLAILGIKGPLPTAR